ncbi:MAG TPA: class II aldolase/adducin family protein [Gammaproteobacteria bacterium]
MSLGISMSRPVSALLAGALLAACSSEPGEAQTAAATARAEEPALERALLEDLVLANRILTREEGILDIQAHVSVRSRTNPERWYMARYVAPGGASVSDMSEYDLDGFPIVPRGGDARETFLHSNVYKARPNVQAVVHAHTPEFVSFAMSTVPLYWGPDDPVPVWDIRPLNDGRNGIVSDNRLGASMMETMGEEEAVLLWGHGITLAAGSLPEAVHRVVALRRNAELQLAAASIGSTAQPEAIVDDSEADQAMWEHYRRIDLKPENGVVPADPAPRPSRPDDPVDGARHDLVLANRILANDMVDLLKTSGHVSVRNPGNPNRYFVATAAPGSVTDADIIERDLGNPGSDATGLSIHEEIYRANPGVMAVLYSRSPEIVAFTQDVPLRPVANGAAFIGDALPVFEMSTLDPRQPALSNPALGSGVAAALGTNEAVLLSGHGFVMTGNTIYNAVRRAYYMRQNAISLRQAMALGGTVTYLNERRMPTQPQPAVEVATATPAQGGGGQRLGPVEGREWVYWAQTTPLD